jgi:hypothetical protein
MNKPSSSLQPSASNDLLTNSSLISDSLKILAAKNDILKAAKVFNKTSALADASGHSFRPFYLTNLNSLTSNNNESNKELANQSNEQSKQPIRHQFDLGSDANFTNFIMSHNASPIANDISSIRNKEPCDLEPKPLTIEKEKSNQFNSNVILFKGKSLLQGKKYKDGDRYKFKKKNKSSPYQNSLKLKDNFKDNNENSNRNSIRDITPNTPVDSVASIKNLMGFVNINHSNQPSSKHSNESGLSVSHPTNMEILSSSSNKPSKSNYVKKINFAIISTLID